MLRNTLKSQIVLSVRLLINIAFAVTLGGLLFLIFIGLTGPLSEFEIISIILIVLYSVFLCYCLWILNKKSEMRSWDKFIIIAATLSIVFWNNYLIHSIHVNKIYPKENERASIRGIQSALELYHQYYKHYPVNWKNLLKEGYLPEGAHLDTKGRIFIYYLDKKQSDNYILFGVGDDGMPGTSDDVLAPIDSQKHYSGLTKTPK
jgi:hypothetical protein